MTNRIHVCSVDRIEQITAKTGARHLVTLINNELQVATPSGIEADKHLRLIMNDISEPRDNLIKPEKQHIENLLDFTASWDQQAPMVIHCLAGISRSTAAMFITLCALNPKTDESTIATALRAASPTAHPNRLLVEYGDTLLNRQGRMSKAIIELSPCTIANEGIPFSLPVLINNS